MEKLRTEALPLFHITGRPGWINDPNGLVCFNGKYHAFYQYYPSDTNWGPMHWGHAASDDLVSWEPLPIALAPGGEGDRDGCFSGSAIVWEGRLWLLYTGFEENGGGEAIRQVQCLASSEDGVHFVKHGIVIGTEQLPVGYVPTDFRDPKVWRHGEYFYCVVAAKHAGGRGRVLLYRSEDLSHWQFVGDLFGKDSRGTMIECPDYIESLGALVLCEQFQPNEGHEHLNIHSSRWYLGELDYDTGHFTPQSEGICDYGFDFYAPQSFSGENTMLAWLNMWDRNVPSAQYGFAGMLTLARRLSVEGNRLCQSPVLPQTTTVRTETVEGLATLSDRATTGVITIEATNVRSLTLTLRSKAGQQTRITVNRGELVFDRSSAGVAIKGVEQDEDTLAGIRRMPVDTGRLSLTVVMDRYSVEIFSAGRAMSSTVYPDADADGIMLVADVGTCTYTRGVLKV